MKPPEYVIAMVALAWSLFMETFLPGTLGDILTAGSSAVSWLWWVGWVL